MKFNVLLKYSIYIATIILAVAFFILINKTHIVTSTIPTSTIAAQNNQSNQETDSNSEIIPKPEQNSNQKIFSGKIPILMYHHIRDYNDPTDQIGVNLSVPPTKFANQLDYIVEKGYNTTTFESVLNNKIPDNPLILSFDDGYQNFYQNAYAELKKRHMTAVVFDIANNQDGEYMTPAELKEISQYGIEIGSHTLSHPDLSKASPERASKEITESKSKLENLLNKKIISFCYPSGKYSPTVISLLREAGYNFATTTKSGTGDFTNPFELYRFRINNDTNIKGIF